MMFKNWRRFLPTNRSITLQMIILLVVLLFVMPNVNGWMATHLAGSGKVWIFSWLVLLQIIWALIWYVTYWGLREYISNVILVRNFMIGLDFVAACFVIYAVLENPDVFVTVMTVIGYASMLVWYSYVFGNPKDSAKTAAKLHHFWRQHRHLNQDDVKKMIKQNNAEMMAWVEKHESKNEDKIEPSANKDDDSSDSKSK